MNTFLNFTFWGNTVKNRLMAAGCILVLFAIIRLFKNIVLGKIQAIARSTASNLDDMLVTVLEKTVVPLAYILSIYAGIKFLETSPRADKIINGAAMVVVTWASGSRNG
ncbi:MAG TPA: hypothetical protein VHC50_03880 [Puia sp.]|nr:hypothetical protein [Puia sp.]